MFWLRSNGTRSQILLGGSAEVLHHLEMRISEMPHLTAMDQGDACDEEVSSRHAAATPYVSIRIRAISVPPACGGDLPE